MWNDSTIIFVLCNRKKKVGTILGRKNHENQSVIRKRIFSPEVRALESKKWFPVQCSLKRSIQLVIARSDYEAKSQLRQAENL
jgi:hypothetical protein